jgi:hypothetical protein
MSLKNTTIRVSPFSDRIVLARFGKDPTLALESRDAHNEFLQALVQYVAGEMPEVGAKFELFFGGGDEQFYLTLERIDAAPAKTD